jgi:inner membrane protease subunit 2
MSPTISPFAHETGREDWVVLRPYLPRARPRGEGEGHGGIHRGDVVTFWKPHKPEETSIKRVVAVEGDIVYPRRGYALESHGSRLEGMPDGLQDKDEDSVVRKETGKVVVPYGHVWIEGDNHGKSYDSNDFGPISKGLIQEKAVWVWRDWFEFLRVGDLRGKGGSKVVEGRGEVPDAFLE